MNFKDHLTPILHNILANLIWWLITLVSAGALVALGKSFGVSVFSVITIRAPVWSIVLIAIACMLLLKLLGVFFRSSPAFLFIREIFASSGAPGITLLVHPPTRPANAQFKCKILVDIINHLPRRPVHLAGAYFVFNKNSPVKRDPKWSLEHTGRIPLRFPSPKTKMHDWPDLYLQPGEPTNIWIGVDPQHADEHIKQAIEAKNVGQIFLQMTQWTDSGRPKTRLVRVKL